MSADGDHELKKSFTTDGVAEKRKLKVAVQGTGYEPPPFTRAELAHYEFLISAGHEPEAATEAVLHVRDPVPLVLSLSIGEVVEVLAVGERHGTPEGGPSIRVQGATGVSAHVSLADTEPL